jgi:hypothetical protein
MKEVTSWKYVNRRHRGDISEYSVHYDIKMLFRCSFGSRFFIYEFESVSVHELLYHPSHRFNHLCSQSWRLARFSEPSVHGI